MFLIGFSIDVGRTLHGFQIKFVVVRRILHWFRNVLIWFPIYLERALPWCPIDSRKIWDGFWLVLKYVWSDSPFVLKRSLMDSQLLSFVRFLVRFLIDSAMFLTGFSIDSELASDGSPIDFDRIGVGSPVDSAKQITWSTHGECCINPSALILIESSLNFNWRQNLMRIEWVPKED